MEISGKKVICYTTRKSMNLDKKVYSVDSPSAEKGLWISYAKRCRRKHYSSKQREIRRVLLDGKLSDPMHKIHVRTPASDQKRLNSLLNKPQRGKLKCASDDVEVRVVRKRRKKKKRTVESDEALRLQQRTRYLIFKMKLEMNLIDAYSGDGWKGQSREKIKPEKELQRAEKQILKCKLGIRDAIRQLDSLGSIGSIGHSMMQPDGSVFHEHIFCAKCRSNEAFPDNDIILCDGTCNSGFHQKCLEPPLERIPPGEQPWLCKFCNRKMEILEAVNAHLGTCFSINNSWEDIFAEAVNHPNEGDGHLEQAAEWPSEDSADEDYDPVAKETSGSRSGNEEDATDDSASSSGSDCDIISHRRQRADVDYKKLHDEMFGKELAEDEQLSEDEDWGPHRKKRRMETNDGTCMAGSANDAACSSTGLKDKISHDKRSIFRIPSDSVKILRLAFAENELPSRSEKENLSRQLGIAQDKVSKWFKNARYTALKMRKAEVGEHKTSVARAGSPCDEVASTDSSYLLPLSSIIQLPDKLRKILCRRHSKHIGSHIKQKKRNCDSIKSHSSVPVNQHSNHQGPLHIEADETAKSEQLYLAELERLYILEDKLRNLKAMLSRYNVSTETDSREQNVIYVPVAELIDKS